MERKHILDELRRTAIVKEVAHKMAAGLIDFHCSVRIALRENEAMDHSRLVFLYRDALAKQLLSDLEFSDLIKVDEE